MDLCELLIANGFNKNLSDTYNRLLNNQTIDINSFDHQTLDMLIKLNIIAVINNRVLLINPKIVFSSWKNEIKWSKENRNIKSNNLINLLPNNISIKDIDDIEEVIEKKFNFSEISENINIGQNINQITALICKSILSVKNELRALAIDTELSNTSTIWGTIEPKLITGMKYTRICDVNEILLHGIEIKKKDINLGVNLYVLNQNSIKEKIYIFDNKAIFIFEAINDFNYLNSGQLINSEYITKVYIQKFDDYLSKSIKASFTLKKINELYKSRLLKIDDIFLKKVYKSICDYGIFSEYQNNKIEEMRYLIDYEYLKVQLLNNNNIIYLPNIKINEL